MTYEKPNVQVMRFENRKHFMVYSPSAGATSYEQAEAEAKVRAVQVMGWNPAGGFTVQKGYDGKWMAFCYAVLNADGTYSYQVRCDSF